MIELAQSCLEIQKTARSIEMALKMAEPAQSCLKKVRSIELALKRAEPGREQPQKMSRWPSRGLC